MTTLSNLIDSYAELKMKKKVLEADIKIVGEQIRSIEKDIFTSFDGEGITESKNARGKVTAREAIYPKVEDWDQAQNFILQEQDLGWLERRLAVLKYRETLGLGRIVPGVVPNIVRKLTFRES